MKNKALYIILIALSINAMVAGTIFSVDYITKFKAAPNFDASLLILSIGFVALTLVSLIMAFILFVKLLKGDKDGKNS